MGYPLSLFLRHAGIIFRFCWITFSCLATGAGLATNPIQLENAKTGTTRWQISKVSENQSDIQGYASLTSVNRGGAIDLFVSTTSPSYTIDIYRIGWYGGAGGRHVLGPIARTGIAQSMPSPDAAGLAECDWIDPYTLVIPATAGDPTDWASGVYLVKLTADSGGWQNYILFTVRDDDRVPAAPYVFQSSVNTWQAYNSWGGKSLYSFNSSGGIPARKVSFNRPYTADGSGDFLQWEINMVRFLEREGYDVSYATNVDLHEQGLGLISPHSAFLSVGHDEYWSYEMKSAAHQARDQGLHLVFFGADAVYWQVRYEPSTLASAAPNRTLVSYKGAAETSDPYWLDGDPSKFKFVTTAFRNFPSPPFNVQDDIAQPENGLIGVMYHGSPFNGDIVISDASNWVFDGTGLSNGYHFAGLLGYETDAMFDNGFAPAGLQKLADSPDNWGGSQMTVYTAAGGGVVFAAGSIQWAWGVDDYEPPCGTSRLDRMAQQVTRNILARFAAPPAPAAGAPVFTSAACGNAQAMVTFSPPAGAAEGSVTGYTVTSNPAGGADSNAGSTALTHLVTGLNNGKTYTFTVTATTAEGISAPSNATNSVIPASPPDPPTDVVAGAGDAQASVSFTAPDNGGSRISGYTVISSPPGGVDTGAGSTALTHLITGLTNGIGYTFSVIAANSMGAGAASGASNNVTPARAPDAPSGVAANPGDGQASVSFSAPASDGGSAVTGYTVISHPAGGVDSNAGTLALTHVVTGLSNGTAYTFTVSASNSAGTSQQSGASNSVTPAGPPGLPTGVVASAGNAQANVVFTAPGNNGALITGYTVVSDPPGGVDTNAGSTALSHLVTGLSNGVQYTFTVSAANAAGNGASSAPSNAVIPAAAPSAATAAASGVSHSGATLNGTVSANGALTSVTFEYGLSAAYGASAAATPAMLAANAAGSVALTLSGLACNVGYHFRVYASNSAGTGSGGDRTFTTAGCAGTVPGAPNLIAATPGRGRATLAFTAPASDGGNPVRSYAAVCTAPNGIAKSAAATGSPIAVLGLKGGVTYACSVSATNGVGSGAPSQALSVTPQQQANIAPVLMLLLL